MKQPVYRITVEGTWHLSGPRPDGSRNAPFRVMWFVQGLASPSAAAEAATVALLPLDSSIQSYTLEVTPAVAGPLESAFIEAQDALWKGKEGK